MSRRYAEGTSVDTTRSRIELEEIVRRFGASQIMTYTDIDKAIVQFAARERLIRLTINLPDPDNEAFTTTPTGRERSASSARDAYEQEVRRRWRAMVLLVKAKVTAVNEGIVEFEEEFLAHVVMSNGETVFERTNQTIALEYQQGKVQSLLPAPGRS